MDRRKRVKLTIFIEECLSEECLTMCLWIACYADMESWLKMRLVSRNWYRRLLNLTEAFSRLCLYKSQLPIDSLPRLWKLLVGKIDSIPHLIWDGTTEIEPFQSKDIELEETPIMHSIFARHPNVIKDCPKCVDAPRFEGYGLEFNINLNLVLSTLGWDVSELLHNVLHCGDFNCWSCRDRPKSDLLDMLEHHLCYLDRWDIRHKYFIDELDHRCMLITWKDEQASSFQPWFLMIQMHQFMRQNGIQSILETADFPSCGHTGRSIDEVEYIEIKQSHKHWTILRIPVVQPLQEILRFQSTCSEVSSNGKHRFIIDRDWLITLDMPLDPILWPKRLAKMIADEAFDLSTTQDPDGKYPLVLLKMYFRAMGDDQDQLDSIVESAKQIYSAEDNDQWSDNRTEDEKQSWVEMYSEKEIIKVKRMFRSIERKLKQIKL